MFAIRLNLKLCDANLVNAKFDKVKQLLIKGYGRFIGDAGSPLSSQGHCLVWVGTFSHKRLVATHRTSDTSTKASPHPLEVHEEDWDNVAWNQGGLVQLGQRGQFQWLAGYQSQLHCFASCVCRGAHGRKHCPKPPRGPRRAPRRTRSLRHMRSIRPMRLTI